jgi:signal transduction histidine kinase
VKGTETVRSRGKRNRNSASEADANVPVPAGQAPPKHEADGRGDGSPAVAQTPPAKRKSSSRSLKNWHVRSRLLLLIAIPTLTAVAFGGLRIASSVQSAAAYQRVETLAGLGSQTIGLAQNLENERDQTVYFIALGFKGGRASHLSVHPAVRATAKPQLQVVNNAQHVTDGSRAQVEALLGQIGGSYAPQTQEQAASVQSALAGLQDVRDASTGTALPVLVVVQKYQQLISNVLALNSQIAQGVADPTLSQTVVALGLVSTMKEEASEQRGILTAALLQGRFEPGQLAALENAQSAQTSSLQSFDSAANVTDRLLWNNSLNAPGSFVYLASSEEQQAIALQQSSGSLAKDSTTADDWYGAMSNPIEVQMGSVERELSDVVTARAATLRKSALTSAVVAGVAVILVLVIALLFTAIVGRSMIRPLRRLRAGALEVAGISLPETVRRMSETDGDDAQLDVAPIDVDSVDEIGEVARAFDQVHREALRLAANEAALRGNVNAMFVNLSRRSQSLVERQIHLIDSLELGEQDAERLSSLFQMDHLATRMRRNSENLLVLAGHDVSRRWNQPVVLVDVLRAAVSEIEQYERVTLNVQPGIAVRGQAVNDVVHLLSELAENATSFSSAETPVTIAGHLLSSGGVLLDITDQGVGMGAEEMAHANWRLDNPPVVDVAVSRRMGLFVVARLAARHGIRVRLRPAASGGLTALVWLPDEAVTHEAEGSSPGQRRSDMNAMDAAADAPAASGFATAGPAPAGAVAGVFSTGEWGSGERSAAEEAVTAARTPKFAPLRADADDNGGLRARRVPGAGSRPGTPAGPSAPFRTSPQPAADAGAAQFSGGPPAAVEDSPAADAGGERLFGNGTDAFGNDTDAFRASPDPFGNGTDAFSAGAGAFGSGAVRPGNGTDRFGNGTDSAGDGPDMFTSAADVSGTAPPPPAPEVAAPPPAAPEPATPEPAGPEPATAELAATDADPFAASADPFAASADGFGTSPQPVLGAPAAGKVADRDGLIGDSLSAIGWSPGSSVHGGVVVPPSASLKEESRLPIFESVESDWFRRGRHAVAGPGQEEEEAATWTSPADDGWRAAEVASAPSSSGITSAGLPKRVPKANLVPGTAGSEPAAAAAPAPARSAAATRERFANFQRGIKEGRAARRGDDEAPDRDDDGGT